MLKKSYQAITLALLLLLSGCSTVTVNRDGGPSVSNSGFVPDYEESLNFYFWGLSGEHHIDTEKICKSNGGVEEVQTEMTFSDGLLGFITLGIYSPHTARVWCKGGDE